MLGILFIEKVLLILTMADISRHGACSFTETRCIHWTINKKAKVKSWTSCGQLNNLRQTSFDATDSAHEDQTDSDLNNIFKDRNPVTRDFSEIPSPEPGSKLPGRRQQVIVGDPQRKVEKEMSVTSILKELTAIQEQGPQKYCVLGTRHCSYLHQRIIELL